MIHMAFHQACRPTRRIHVIGSLYLIVGKVIIPVANVPTECVNGRGTEVKDLGLRQVIVVVKIVTALHRQVRVPLFLEQSLR